MGSMRRELDVFGFSFVCISRDNCNRLVSHEYEFIALQVKFACHMRIQVAQRTYNMRMSLCWLQAYRGRDCACWRLRSAATAA